MTLTNDQVTALVCMLHAGTVTQGANELTWGSFYRVSARTIQGLAKKGFCTLQVRADGVVMGVPPVTGRGGWPSGPSGSSGPPGRSRTP